jgi:uncharacterized membrane protein
MIGLLSQILCWIKQIGCMVLNAGIDLANLFIAGIAAAVQGLVDAWPIAMPEMPDLPDQLQTAFKWIAWTPLPVHAGIQFLTFAIGVWVAWLAIAIVLRWAKAIDG